MSLPSELCCLALVEKIQRDSDSEYKVGLKDAKSWDTFAARGSMALAQKLVFTAFWYGTYGSFEIRVPPSKVDAASMLIQAIMVAESKTIKE